ncbi:antibiotic biosynthesis monooxygenase family protein [Candidatus Bipolaricaulota bacterium]
MYAGTTMFTMPPGSRPEMEQLADQMLPMMKQMPGFVSISFVVNEETNEYGGIALWETKEDAETATSQTAPKMDEAVGNVAIGPIRRAIYEVYEPQI